MIFNFRGNVILGLLISLVASLFCSFCLAQTRTSEILFKPPELSPSMLLYSYINYALYFLWPAFHIFIAWLILQSGLAKKLMEKAEIASKNEFARLAIFFIALTLSTFLFELPLKFASSFCLERHFGLSQIALLDWLGNSLKSQLVIICLGIPLFALVLHLIKRFPKNWWLVLWAAVIPITVVCTFLEPLVLEPVFNNFHPLPKGPLRSDIEALALKAGISNAQILVADKSKQTKRLNAYVSGIGSSTRIVFWDNILQRMPKDQVLFVTGHEIGHYVLKHIYIGMALSLAGSFFVFLFLGRNAKKILLKLPRKWGIQSLSDLRIIPVITIVFCLGQLLLAPLTNAVSRSLELQADEFGLELYPHPLAAAQSFVTLAETSLACPKPPSWIEFWMFSHPSLAKRIDYALSTKKKAIKISQ